MARKRSISAIETEIAKVKEEMTSVQQKYDTLAEKLLALQKQQKEYEAKGIMDAYARSGKSYRELMTFLET